MGDWRAQLKERFGKRVAFDRVERTLYGHDVASMPEMITKLFETLPDAVAQPVNVEEVRFLVRLSRESGVPLVPRGAATSGYGGAVPAQRGIVVDFTRMSRLVSVDAVAKTVTVEPGMNWAELERKLAEHDLATRLYPTSAPGATVAGWVAQGGAGIGSFEYGFIKDNVVSAEVVTPDGEVRLMQGPDLGLVTDAEGITGLITQVTLALRERDEDVPILAGFPNLAELNACLVEVSASSLPLWHVGFSSPEFVRRKQEATDESHLPVDTPLALFVFPKRKGEAVLPGLRRLVEAHDGRFFGEELARHEWEERFYPMRLKRLGPSLIPSEAAIPVAKIAAVAKDAGREIKGIAIEGIVAARREATLLAFLTGDERTLAYTIGFSKSLFMKDIALRHGGRPYTTGLFFTDEAEQAMGKAQVEQLRRFKQEHDPEGLMNPLKVLPSGKTALLKAAMSAARLGKPFLPLAEKVLPAQGRPSPKLPESVVNAAYACAQCGYCNNVCTLFGGDGWESASPRGKWTFLKEYAEGKVPMTQGMVDKLLMCTTCKRCDPVCQVKLPIERLWQEMRGFLVHEQGHGTIPAFEMMGAAFEQEHNIWAGLREDRDAWLPKDVQPAEKGEICYWAGCTASYVETNVAQNAVHILKEAGVDFTYLGKDEACCGVPFLMSGKWDVWEAAVRHNLGELKKRGVKTVVASCPGCWVTLSHHYKEWAKKLGLEYDLEVRHITEFTEELVKQGKLQFKQGDERKVTWHDPCHIGRHGGIYEAPRQVLQAIPGVELVEMEHNRENARCCGSVLTRVGAPPTADTIGGQRLAEAEAVGAEALVTTCPCCEVQLQVSADNLGSKVPVEDWSDLVAGALGYDVKETSNYVRQLWGVFAQALEQMTVDGMAQMMDELMPGMFEAMPGLMQTGMKAMKPLPGPVQDAMLGVMDKMVPALMPKLMDQMLPPMMPEILALMEKKIPGMPDSMRKLMPKMMPQIMAKLMPHMLPGVLVKVKPRMMELMSERIKQRSA